ncbi:hypothetical protein ACFSYH_02895 [Populibacterium corticicola]|uniref:LPXTG cell wall anchor domain-containing protein n=2 Tax=Populibacterium corticicola TaxID=1812826 RepID=A0ABW5XAP3_9MICO
MFQMRGHCGAHNVKDMVGFIVFLLIAWAVLSILGFVIEGLLWLGFIGLVLFAITVVVLWIKRKASDTTT